MKELECIWGNISSEESCKLCGVACSSRMPKNSSYSSTDFASADSKNDAIGLSIMLYLETNLKNENSKVCGVPLKIAREWLREHINGQPMNIPSAGGGMSTTPPSFKLDVKPEQPAEGLEEEMEKFFETMPVLEHENIFEDTFQNIARHFAEWGEKSIKSMIQDRYDENCRCAEKIKSFGIRACEDNDILSLIENRYE